LGFVDNVVLTHRVSFVPVVEEGILLGYIDLDTVVGVDRENWPITRVNDVFFVCNDNNTVRPELAAKDLLEHLGRTNRRKCLVADGSQLLGVISMSDLISYFALLMQVDPLVADRGTLSLCAKKRTA
jgi:CBS domain-containing protein